MKYYFEQKRDKILTESRLATLEKRQNSIQKQVNNIIAQYGDAIRSNNFSNEKYDNYLIKLEEINDDIKEVRDNLKFINKELSIMETAIKEFDGVEGRIFKMIEIDKLNATQIIARTGIPKSTIYRKIKNINEKMQFGKK